MPRKFLLTVLISAALLAALPLWAGDGEDSKIESSTDLAFTVSSMPEAQLAFTQAWTFPAFQGSGFLTRGNNLRTALSYNVTPVSMNAGLDLILTPVAFAQVKAGGSLGTGWNCAFLDIAPHAWGLNRPQADDDRGLIGGEPFEAAIWALYGGAVLQFDLGAVIPGDWTHVLFQTDHQINYRANTLAGEGEAWSHENDGGENRNGFNYYGAYVLGYQMPAFPVLKIIAFMAEMKLKLYAEKDSAYGDDLSWWLFSALANFEINPRFSIAAIVQLSLDRNFDNWRRKVNTNNDVFYTRRLLNKDNPRRLDFYRIAAIFSLKLR